jgi:UDP-2-acetamido-3-amino-2,3-dideoxy-glucuronate N-acetyltransferase
MSLTFIHETASVDDGATIGAGSRIWHFCHIMPGATLGERCILGQNVFISDGVRVGNGVKIQNNVSLYHGVIVEDDVFLGPSCVLTNVINPRAFVERKDEFRETIIRKGATIGANATILCGVEIGAYAMVGAGAVVTKNVPAYALMKGCPARQSGWMSPQGYKLKEVTSNLFECPETGRQFSLKGPQKLIAL